MTGMLPGAAADRVDVVVKIGGGVLRDPAIVARLDAALAGAPALRATRVLLVPGGGAYADAVREADRGGALGDDAAHWLAIRAMDRSAESLAPVVKRASLIADLSAADAVLAAGQIPLLAPYGWLRAVDPLPHSWSVTSDSVAAWVASVSGARSLILVKPVSGPVLSLVDGYFSRALAPFTTAEVLPADRIEDLVMRIIAARPDR